MKRGKPLGRRTALARGEGPRQKTPLRASSRPLSRSKGLARARPRPTAPRREKAGGSPAPGKAAWYDFRKYGRCEGCGRSGQLREAHHVLLRQYVERISPERTWDVANRMLLGVYCGCHAGHHHPGVRDTRVARARIPAPAIAFVRELLGQAADGYLSRRYRAS